jgi:hypothetical protein
MKRLDNSGMTLIEAVLGTILLAIATLMMAQGFATAAKMVIQANTIKESSSNAGAAVELQDYKDRDGITYKVRDASLSLNGDSITGQYLLVTDRNGVTYKEVVPLVIDTVDATEDGG